MNTLIFCALLAAASAQLPTLPPLPELPEAPTTEAAPSVAAYPEDYPRRALDPAIIRGQRVQPGEIPYQVALLTHLADGSSYICGGTLLAPEWVLTAAHCIDAQRPTEVRMGGVNLAQMEYVADAVARISHEDWNPSTGFEADIALLKIRRPADHLLTFVQLAPADTGRLVNETVRASGYGFVSDQGPTSDDLLKVHLRAMSNDECQAAMRGLPINDAQLCATWLTQHGEAVCSGDSGGPLVLHADTPGGIQVGLVSYGLASGCTDGPQVFTRVSSYRQWIAQTMQNN